MLAKSSKLKVTKKVTTKSFFQLKTVRSFSQLAIYRLEEQVAPDLELWTESWAESPLLQHSPDNVSFSISHQCIFNVVC